LRRMFSSSADCKLDLLEPQGRVYLGKRTDEMTLFDDHGTASGNGLPADVGAQGAEPAALDFQALCHRCMGNIELAERVLGKFQERLPDDMAGLEESLRQGDTAKAAVIAHRIKGSAASVSADGLSEIAAQIEELSRIGRAADIPPRLERLHGEWQRHLDRASALRAARGAG